MSPPAPVLYLSATLLWLAVSALQPASASSIATEREQLDALIRQLELADRLAEQAARTRPEERARYHFDYTRLRADIARVQSGVRDYLVPQRAQPRDPLPLSGDYSHEPGKDGEPEAQTP